jgi:hypothetical protein
VLFRFAFYNVRADADPDSFLEFETRIAEAYQAGCRTFGWESLGTWRCRPRLPGSWPFGHVDPYIVEGDDPVAATRIADAAPDPPGFAEIVAECRTFMTGQEDRTVVWLHALYGQPSVPTPLGQRALVVRFGAESDASEHADHAGWLGRFGVQGVEGSLEGEVCVHDSGRQRPRRSAANDWGAEGHRRAELVAPRYAPGVADRHA